MEKNFQLNHYIDSTLLKANATLPEFTKLCNDAKHYKFKTVCVNPAMIPFVKQALISSDVKVCTTIGFPLGQNTIATKVFEIKDAINHGADELDVVINVGAVIDDKFEYVDQELTSIRQAAGKKTLKVIFETSLLTNALIEKLCHACVAHHIDFVKTSTGFSTGGATIEVVTLMKKCVGEKAQVKASGGIKSTQDALAMIKAGATRIGTSQGVAIVTNVSPNNSTY